MEARGAPRKPKKVKPGSALVVVESPAKAQTIEKYLGSGYVVKASVGHVRDLPKSKIGVDFENDFEPTYEVIEGKKKVVAEIRKAARENETVYLASDPDREGEAIAWHIAEEIKDVNTNLKRVLINEITKKGVAAAIAAPREIDMNKTDAQQARRILDRLVGYEISPILWNKVQRGLSAGPRAVGRRAPRLRARGRDQGVQARGVLVGRRDLRVRRQPPPFEARIWKWKGEKAEPKTADEANAIAAELNAGTAVGRRASTRRSAARSRRRRSSRSRLQQDAARKLRFSAKRTMALAQRLYEGVELGDEGPTGLITYMRTDSTRVSDDALTALRTHIGETVRRGVPARDAEHVRQQGARAGRPRGDPPDADGVDAREGRGRARRAPRGQRARQALHADLAALRRVADGAGGVRRDHGRHRSRRGACCARPARS